MDFVSSAHPVVGELCHALGLNPTKIRKLALVIDAGEIAYLDVTMYPEEKELFLAGELLNKRFRLVEMLDDDQEPTD
jgi:hypothetical protein